jgi:hypothetical protein
MKVGDLVDVTVYHYGNGPTNRIGVIVEIEKSSVNDDGARHPVVSVYTSTGIVSSLGLHVKTISEMEVKYDRGS